MQSKGRPAITKSRRGKRSEESARGEAEPLHALATGIAERACAVLGRRPQQKKRAELVEEVRTLLKARLRMCDHKDIVGIPVLTEEQLLATVRREQSSDASSE